MTAILSCPASPINASNMLLEIRGLHVIGIAAEACVAPSHVYGVLPGVTEAAQAGHVAVVDACRMQRGRQLVAIELRVVA